MAETVGIVAAGVALAEIAAKIGVQIFTLKGLWEEIKNVPDTLKILLDDIKLLSPVLLEVETGLGALHSDTTAWNDSTGGRISNCCRNALEGLTESTHELSSKINSTKRIKRGVAKVKLALKKDFWVKHEKRLQRVFQMLEMVQQYYMLTLMRRQPDLLVSRLKMLDMAGLASHDKNRIETQDDKKGSQEDPKAAQGSTWPESWERHMPVSQWIGPSIFGSFSLHSTSSSCRTLFDKSPQNERDTGCSQYYLQIRPPSWITQRAWDILTWKSYTGFKLYFRQYSIVPSDAPVFRCAESGDIDGLLDLFNKKLASPFDRDENGETLIHAALHSANIEAISTMVDWGLDLSQAFHQLALSKNAYDEYADAWSTGPLGLKQGLAFLAITNGLFLNPDAMKLMMAHLRPGHYQQSLEDRLSLLQLPAHHLDADSLRFALRQDGKLKPGDGRELEEHGFPILKLIACQYKVEVDIKRGVSPKRQRWRKLARDVFRTATLLHCQDGLDFPLIPPGTPMLAVISDHYVGFPPYKTFAKWRRVTECALMHWLEDLEICNIDLRVYGATEKKLFLENEKLRYLCYGPHYGREGWRLESFEYGAKTRDWKFSWDLEVEALAGEFWNMVENPPLHVVGAWPDDGGFGFGYDCV